MRNDEKNIAVCIIVENLAVPADRRVWQEANALSAAGYSVSIICPKGPGYSRAREGINNIEIYRHARLEWPGLAGHVIEYVWALAAEFLLALRVYARITVPHSTSLQPPGQHIPDRPVFQTFRCSIHL